MLYIAKMMKSNISVDDDESRDSREWDDSSEENAKPEQSSPNLATSIQQPLATSNTTVDTNNSLLTPISDQMPLRQIPAPVKPVARYVETSLDDLSFASTTSSTSLSSSELNKHDDDRTKEVKKMVLKPIVMHATNADNDQGKGNNSSFSFILINLFVIITIISLTKIKI